MTITRKLAVLATVPLLAVVAFAALALRITAGQVFGAAQLRSMVAISAQVGDLTHQLQRERTCAAALLTGEANPDRTNAYLAQMQATDASIAQYRQLRGRMHAARGNSGSLLRQVDDDLAGLPALRKQVESSPGTVLSATTFHYRIIIADLLAYRGSVAGAGRAGADLAGRINSGVTLARAQESVSQQEVAVLASQASGVLTPAAQQAITATRTGYTEAVLEFQRIATPEWQTWLDRSLTGPGIIAAGRLEDAVARATPGRPLPVDASWTTVMDERTDRLQQVEQKVDASVLVSVTDFRNTQRKWALSEGLAVLLAVVSVIVLALRLGRPMIRELRRLRAAAHAVAHERLPAAVAALSTGGALGEATPEEFAAAAGDAVEVRGRDEIAAVGAAFNTVSREAVRIAAEQAAMRDRMGTVFVGLARRAERLTGALVQALDAAERDEPDPERLARLFELDHLASRMRRNNHSLLVLGGEATARVRSTDAPIEDVLRAAAAQTERYTRIDVGTTDQGILVEGRAVDHLVHLFAELLDNATAYSKPGTRVTAEARLLTDRLVVQVCDRGIGLGEDRWDSANEKLATPPPVEIAAVRAMGLTVVGHLASWYGIRVELRPRPGGGTIAEVTLPDTVFGTAGEADPAPDPAPVQAPVPTAAPEPAPAPVPPAAPEPPPATAPAPPATESTTAGTTGSGLPRRRRPAASTTEPAPVHATTPSASDSPPPAAQPSHGLAHRDPGQVSAAMAAYARGIGASRAGRGAPKPLLSDPNQKEDA
ncbi:sensor histidine kinase [Kitasatospora sp. RG8]|uniref:sensor histidine kinase n=1 Tax=Kitasatospora sp. RG8 TaxID=2820815 RepID=UPI001ADF1D14|nr:nitrate- and nitrite sensing domain-containing protein [Kitasatospora sp. RG8]MBP0455609.1 sensor histidine kinase [Kitasatospora sp. RG8]